MQVHLPNFAAAISSSMRLCACPTVGKPLSILQIFIPVPWRPRKSTTARNTTFCHLPYSPETVTEIYRPKYNDIRTGYLSRYTVGRRADRNPGPPSEPDKHSPHNALPTQEGMLKLSTSVSVYTAVASMCPPMVSACWPATVNVTPLTSEKEFISVLVI